MSNLSTKAGQAQYDVFYSREQAKLLRAIGDMWLAANILPKMRDCDPQARGQISDPSPRTVHGHVEFRVGADGHLSLLQSLTDAKTTQCLQDALLELSVGRALYPNITHVSITLGTKWDGITEPLTKEEIRTTIRTNHVDDCFGSEVTYPVRFTVVFNIAYDGMVKLKDTSDVPAAQLACVVRAVEALRFRASPGVETVRYPFVVTPREDGDLP